jgi:hypothetical protein
VNLNSVEEMTSPVEIREFRRRRALLLPAIAVVVITVMAGLGVTALGQGASGSAATVADSGDTASGAMSNEADDATGDTPAGDFDLASLSPSVAAQMEYLRAHWQDTSSDQFGYLEENDCVNFTSQSLLARGWETDDEWWYDESGDPYASSEAWRSSTYFMWYLEEHPERATALTDAQRDQVKVGDIVQFDWDDSGDRDHTGVVTSVTTELDGSITILYAGHTDATLDRSVDWAITEYHPGGVAYYWSIPE